MGSTLLVLPAEILDLIWNKVGVDDLRSIRLTSRELKYCSLPVFRKRCFSNLRTNLTTENVSRLKDIVANDTLTADVKSFSLLLEAAWGIIGSTGYAYHWNRSETGCLQHPLPDLDSLLSIIARLPKDVGFMLVDDVISRDETSTDLLSSSDGIAIILHAIAELGLTPKSFGIQIPFATSIPLNMERLDFASLEHPNVRIALAKLDMLALQCLPWPENLDWMKTLLTSATQVRILRLCLIDDDGTDILNCFSAIKQLPRLERLWLERMQLNEEDLTCFLLKSRITLQQLTLDRINLKTEIWPVAFRKWVGLFPRLNSISVGSLSHPSSVSHLAFPTIRVGLDVEEAGKPRLTPHWGTFPMISGASYHGPNADAALEKLAEACHDVVRGVVPGGIRTEDTEDMSVIPCRLTI